MTVNFLDSDLRISEWELTEHLTLLSIRPCIMLLHLGDSQSTTVVATLSD